MRVDHKEAWAPKNWCFWIVMMEKTLESSSDSKEIKPVNSKRNQPWIFIGVTDAEAPKSWPLMPIADSLGKTLMLGKIRAGGEGGNREWDYCVASLTQWIRVWANWGTLKSRDALNASVHGITKSWTQLHDWTTTSNALSVPPGKSSNDLLYTVKSPSLMGFHTFRK